MVRCRCSKVLRLLLTGILLLGRFDASAGEPAFGVLPKAGESISMTALTVGNLGVFDEYLSPNVYDGFSVGLMGQRLHPMKRHDDWLFQSSVKGGFSNMTARNRSGLMNSVLVDGRFSWQKIWIDDSRSLTLTAGPGIYAKVGGVLNVRNTNNPAQLKLYVAAAACGSASYKFHIGKLPLSLGWQMEIPLLGYTFAPTFGLQYYEIGYFGRFGEASHFGWVGNSFGLGQIVFVDIPVGRSLIRTGYSGDYYRYRIGGLRCKMYENAFLLGLVRRIEFKRTGR